MIIKMGEQLDWGTYYKTERRLLRAVKMEEDFMLETPLGFLYGKKGQWVVDVGDDLRFPCDETVFLQSYTQTQEKRVSEKSL